MKPAILRLGMMIRKALDADGKRLFQDGEKACIEERC